MEIQERLAQLRTQIRAACERAGRDPNEVRLLAATKGRNLTEIQAALQAGIDLIGENTVQEALGKFEFLPQPLEKHFIGTLQRNKVRKAIGLFSMIQSVNSLELARAIDREATQLRVRYPVLMEVNPAGEATKRDVAPKAVEGLLAQMKALEFVRVEGLMAMMPYMQDPKGLRTYFRQMKELLEGLKQQTGLDMKILSMGMSQDFEIAIEEGATLIRLGTALFEPRG
jgi:pyridoxal phosphate enzyme (YggS family)